MRQLRGLVHRLGHLGGRLLAGCAAFGLALGVAGLLLAQTAPNTSNTSTKTLVVNGRTVNGAVLEMEGRSYVDVEALTKAIGGQVTIEPDRVVLNMAPATAANGGAPTAASAATSVPTQEAELPDQLSRGFMSTAIAELAEMREWRGAIGVIVQYGIPVSGTWPQDYKDHAREGLEQTGVAARNDADRQAAQLLQNEFDAQSAWADGIVAARQSLNGTSSLNANALQNDTQLQKISACGDFLNGMIVSGMYSDNQSCH